MRILLKFISSLTFKYCSKKITDVEFDPIILEIAISSLNYLTNNQ